MERAKETVGTAKPTMETYFGTKELRARPMTRGEYNAYRGWEMPKDEEASESGYLVEYVDGGSANDDKHKGYISWSPASVFRSHYRSNGRLTFGHAILALKEGKRVARSGWNGKGMFIFMHVSSQVSMDIVPKMTSLPQNVKDEFQNRYNRLNSAESPIDPILFNSIRYQNQLVMVYPDNSIYGWVASPSDVLEEDWEILD